MPDPTDSRSSVISPHSHRSKHCSQGDTSCDIPASQEGVHHSTLQTGWTKGAWAPAGLGSQEWLPEEGRCSLPSPLVSCPPCLVPAIVSPAPPAQAALGMNGGLWGNQWGTSGDIRQTSSVKTLLVLIRGGWCMPLPWGIGSHLCSIYRTQAPEFPGVAVLLPSVLLFWTQFITRC